MRTISVIDYDLVRALCSWGASVRACRTLFQRRWLLTIAAPHLGHDVGAAPNVGPHFGARR